ncbi:hypothetical protein BH09VER1_BH09VER1_43980 [soil metagenome]
MREVYSNPEPARVGYFQSVLESTGIACFVRNQVSSNLVAGMSTTLLAPVLCVVEDEDYERAVALIREAVYPAADENAPDWECPSCQQTVPGTFGVCWNCQRERAGDGTSSNGD